MNIDIIGSFNKETAIDYRVFYTTDYFEWLKDLYKKRGEKITLKELHNNLIKEYGSLVNVIELILRTDSNIGSIKESTYEIIDADNILFEGSEDLMAVRLVMNIEYLDMWIKKFDFNNYITEAFKN
ncbi:TPA: hypothetical protein UO054_004893 [Klebsiella pneumoniae]|uniref:Uncharacterized protein n=1 Tax=Salmonella enterica TaxID=28901 RepID=A0A5T2JNC4_SALER|nr:MULTISPECIES: hypothetical protein [Enterobacteriaceae]EAM3869995.1 hypothetical protein [Salmonella enterica]ECG0119583.1 hypothetical protein [Salmonella enterica subsp. enterica serovar Schwarzengrund]EHB9141731.1 hypothetical protein [Shigella flexneri]EJZ8166690.1 hypothetical protein [Salmonella enterica subsp. enterica serovar Infantis]EKT9461255.1 hypothetical protein [Klebsiella oxytoca]HAH1490630.1 hypothetical protein [Escherichia coli]HBS3688459.1 hypothetical protein [Klebsie